MIGWLKNFMAAETGASSHAKVQESDRIHAAAALMVEAAARDGDFSAGERATIERLLQSHFKLDAASAAAMVDEVLALHEDASDVFRFTSALNKRFSPEERLEIVELLWEVVYADGEAHHYETSLMRRLAGLLYLEDGDVGAARKRVQARQQR
ncbi:MAG: TerB family tellurite resistance protein [Reyranellaceae bacterium]